MNKPRHITTALALLPLLLTHQSYAEIAVGATLKWTNVMIGVHSARIVPPTNVGYTQFDAFGTLRRNTNLEDSVSSGLVDLSGAGVFWEQETATIKEGCNYYVAYTKADFIKPDATPLVVMVAEEEASVFLVMPDCE